MIRLNDGKPWFRRWMWFGARPINEEGRLVMSLGQGGCLLGFGGALIADGNDPWTGLAVAVGFISGLATLAIVFFKIDDDF